MSGNGSSAKVRVSFDSTGSDHWPEPDLSVLCRDRKLPLSAFGAPWGDWIATAAEAAACPPDYVAAPLLAAASALIGNARWAQAIPGWAEPPHLWLGAVGDSGSGKSPGADCLMRDVLPEIEARMRADFADRLWRWRADLEIGRLAKERWLRQLRLAARRGMPPPLPPLAAAPPEPQLPRLRQHDVTIEKVAALLANAAPKGLLLVRDELAGWIGGMNAYHSGGRAFWIEAYGGRPYRVERKSSPNPIIIPHLAVAVYGGTQPEKLARLLREADDGLLARLLWVWPEPVRFRLGRQIPGVRWAITALDRLREIELQPGDPPRPMLVPLVSEARGLLERFGQEMQAGQQEAVPLLRSAYAKARGQALRLALVLELLCWCSAEGVAPPPIRIGASALNAATALLRDYFMPMAERAYGAYTAIPRDDHAALLARWILAARPQELHVRQLQREVRLSGLRTAAQIRTAADRLVDVGWLSPPAQNTCFGPRPRICYRVNPRLRVSSL